MEDKIVQRAVVEILNAVYEADFLGFSYGFRPGRSQHDALDALSTAIYRQRVNWILDADIRAFFDSMSHDWLMCCLEHRIADRRLLRLIGKWLKAGVLEDGRLLTGERGTPQGAVLHDISASGSLAILCSRMILPARPPRKCSSIPMTRQSQHNRSWSSLIDVWSGLARLRLMTSSV